MTHNAQLCIQVVGNEIIVTLPPSAYSVTYFKPQGSSHLLAKDIAKEDDPRMPLSVSAFLVEAWKAANEKARELGWIV
jgi:hypothetical protein